tara:strand:+ start:646 stop:918 length:273 start_codon:yes stop_codon:yes gene_type:complete
MKGKPMKDNHIDKSKIHVCVICAETIKPKFLGLDKDGNKHYWYDGNNALPVADGKCCDGCNKSVVIPERMTQILMSRLNVGIDDNFNKLL